MDWTKTYATLKSAQVCSEFNRGNWGDFYFLFGYDIGPNTGIHL